MKILTDTYIREIIDLSIIKSIDKDYLIVAEMNGSDKYQSCHFTVAHNIPDLVTAKKMFQFMIHQIDAENDTILIYPGICGDYDKYLYSEI